MSRSKNRTLLTATLALLAGTATYPALAVPPEPATSAQADPHAARTVEQIMSGAKDDIAVVGSALKRDVLTDAAKFKEAAPKVRESLLKLKGLVTELKKGTDDESKSAVTELEPQVLTFLVAFGDDATAKELQKTAASANKKEATIASSLLLSGQWIATASDAAAQAKLVPQAKSLADANADSDEVSRALAMMRQLVPASPTLQDQITVIVSGMKTPIGASVKERLEAEGKLKSLENKPLTLAGPRNDGTQFTSADWKGKVILVDFWATWCGPCLAELPRVKKVYADFHGKGLEILGVSCDNDAEDLTKFLAKNKDMPWPQLFDVKTPGWHPLAKSYGIEGIPTMFLIDKKGVVRTVEARENFEELIPKMLAE